MLDQYHMEYEENPDVAAIAFGEKVDAVIEEIRGAMDQFAFERSIELSVYDYAPTSEHATPSRQAYRWIRESNVIACIAPNDHQIAFVTDCMRSNPVMCALLSYTSLEDLDGDIEICGSQSFHLLGSAKGTASRVFAAVYREESKKAVREAAQRALLFPKDAA